MTIIELARDIALQMMGKSGLREWEDSEIRTSITQSAVEMAAGIITGLEGLFEMVASKHLIQEMDDTPPQICFANHAGDFSPTAANDLRSGTPTQVEWAPASLANGSYHQSAKFDFGEHRAKGYKVRIAVELAATPTAGNTIQLWVAPSSSATAATGNPAGASGSDGAYTGYSSNADDSIKQADLVGVGAVTVQATANVQIIECGEFSPRERYGSLIVKNGAGSAFHSDDVEIHVVFDPNIDESQ